MSKLEPNKKSDDKAELSSHIRRLFEEAEEEIEQFNYDIAEQKYKEIIEIEPNNVKALEMLAGVHLDLLNTEAASNILHHCIELTPLEGYTKYFSLGQLHEGHYALNLYKKGIEILERQLENAENTEPGKEDDKKILQRSLSEAYCAITEILMTDCCDEETAEEMCISAIENAIKSDPSNPDAYVCQANFQVVTKNQDEAKKSLEKSLSLWLPQHELIREGDLLEADIPSYDCRIKVSKVLIELDMFNEATKVLDGLVDEDDEVVEVWYLLGFLNYQQGGDMRYNAHYYLTKAKKVAAKTGTGDPDQLAEIKEMLTELKEVRPEIEETNDQESEISSTDEEEMEAENI